MDFILDYNTMKIMFTNLQDKSNYIRSYSKK